MQAAGYVLGTDGGILLLSLGRTGASHVVRWRRERVFADVESSRYERSVGARETCLILDICLYFRVSSLAIIRPRFHYSWHVHTNEDILESCRWIPGLSTSFGRDAVGSLMDVFPMLSIYNILSFPSPLLRTSIYHYQFCISTLHIYRCQ